MSFFLSYVFTKSDSEFLKSFLLLLSTTVIIPLIYFIYKRMKGEIINRDAVIKEERNDVYGFTVLIFSIAFILSLFLGVPLFIRTYLLNFVISTIGVLFINKKFKISIHSMSAAGTSAFLIFVNLKLALLAFIITLVVMWSRVTLRVHSFKEVIAGSVYGFCVTLGVIILVLKYAA